MKKYENKTLGNQFSRIEVTEEFVRKNYFILNRSQEEIMTYGNGEDSYHEREVLCNYLEPLNLIAWCSPESKEEINNGEIITSLIMDVYEATQDFLDYMVFAWGKALDERGLSAGRSIEKLKTWLWLLGRQDLAYLINDDKLYNPYGMPALIAVCEQLGIQVPDECVEFAKHKC